MDSLKKVREPLVLVLLVAVAARLLVVVGTVAAYAGEDFSDSFLALAGQLAYRAGDPALVVLLTALVAACVLVDRTPRARGLGLAALVVVGLSVLVGLGFSLLGMSSRLPLSLANGFDTLVGLVAPVVCLLLLVRFLGLVRPTPGTRTPHATLTAPAAEPDPEPDPVPDPADQPTWPPDVAAGASWQTAGEAAAGAPASTWGTPGQQGGWQPQAAPQPPSLPPDEDPRSDQGR